MYYNNDCMFMNEAYKEAQKAFLLDEVPVGAVIVKDDTVISRGHNTRETENSPLGHAEINAILDAVKVLGTRRLNDCTLYVTLEPCPMCAGTILNANIKRVVYGASDEQWGCLGSRIHLFEVGLPIRPTVTKGIMEKECAKLMTDFFKSKR